LPLYVILNRYGGASSAAARKFLKITGVIPELPESALRYPL
jgi:hypothetical protein